MMFRRPASRQAVDASGTPTSRRPVLVLVVVLQILIPLVMLGIRHLEPERGQLPLGWQMHTTCWGLDDPRCR